MRISPPITVLAILGVAFSGMAWLRAPARDEVRVSVTIPTATYEKLVLWGQANVSADGQAPTAGQALEQIVTNELTRQ